MRVRVNWPLVVLVLGVLAIVGGILLTLVLTHNLDIATLRAFGIFVLGLSGGGSLPLLHWFREKKLDFDLADSDPPKAGA